MKKIIVMIGPPGSGKGTQAKKIAAKYGYAHVSTGDLLRSLAMQPHLTAEEQAAVEKIKSGELVSDTLIYRLIFDKIEKEVVAGQGVVLDGVPRNLEQAEKLQEFFTERNFVFQLVVLEISLTDEESLARLSGRRVCSTCGEIIPATALVSVCPKCGGELVVRADDDMTVITQRIEKQGNKALAPIINFYKERALLVSIDGSQSIDVVEKEIDTVVALS